MSHGALVGQLEERRAELIASGREMLDRSKASDRALTAEETARSDRQIAEVREIDARLTELRGQAEREQRAQLARVGNPGIADDHGSGYRPAGWDGGQAGDAMQIRAANRLQRGQTMRQYLAQRIQSERLARGGAPERQFDAGAYFKGMATGKWDEAGRDQYERRALAEGSVSTGGAVVPIDLYSDIIDIVRNSARVLQAGATIVPLEHYVTNVAKLTADPSPSWRAEGSTISATGSTFSRLSFTTQTLSTVVVASRELLEDVPTLGDEITREMALEFALGLDLACLYGTGYSDNQPQGVKNSTWSVTQTSMGTNGAALSTLTPNAWMGLVNPAYRLLAVNEMGLSGAIMAPRTEKEMVSAYSTINTFAEPPSRLASIARYGTAPLEVYSTNQVPVDLTQGTASTASDLFVGDWSQLLVGIRSGLKIDTLTEAYAGTGQIGFLGWMRADVVVARPSAFDITVGIL
jgi:HK97 family phage major capsid protein